MTTLLLLNGPNLNMLGARETAIYGHDSLQDIVQRCEQFANHCAFSLQHFQSNAEHELIQRIHQTASQTAGQAANEASGGKVAGIVFNPAAFTHTSIALRDALLAVSLPFVEIHLSQPLAREAFRRHSYFSDIAIGTIAGFGVDSYLLGLQALINHLDHTG